MDAEKLINEVHKRLPLWDQRNKEYRDRDKVEKLWHEVAVELNVSSKLSILLTLEVYFKLQQSILNLTKEKINITNQLIKLVIY